MGARKKEKLYIFVKATKKLNSSIFRDRLNYHEPCCPRRPTPFGRSICPSPLRLCCQPCHRHRRQVHWRWCRHRWRCRFGSWYRNSFRLPHHWLRPQPIVEVAALLLRHFGFRPVRGHGSVLFDGCLPHPVRPLSRALSWIELATASIGEHQIIIIPLFPLCWLSS